MKRNHTLALIPVVAAALSLVPLSALLRASAAGVVVPNQETGDARGLLGISVTARAEGRGSPWISFRDGRIAPAEYQGASSLVEQLKADQTRALSIGSADFDEDGVPDLVAGYAGAKGGVISVRRGDTDTIFTNTRDAILHRTLFRAAESSSDDMQSPFFVSSRAFDVPVAPLFLGTGDFDGDGHPDVLTAESGGGALVLLPGDGRGGFGAARLFTLPGRVTAFATGDVNRIDGLADIVVAVKGSGAPRLLIYEGAAGALNAAPEVIALPSESNSIALGQLDDHFPVDIAVAAGRELVIIRGRDRKHSDADGKKLDAEPPDVTRVAVSFSIVSLAVGDFTGDLEQEIALLSDDASCHVFSRAQSSGASWRDASSVALPVQKTKASVSSRTLLPVRVSSSSKDDLLLMDRPGRQLQILMNESATLPEESATQGSASSRLLVAATIDFDGEPAAVLPMRLNADALNDLVVLTGNVSAPTVLLTSPVTTFTVINNSDSGGGSLRQAILDANSSPGADSITFNIPGAGSQSITLLSPLPGVSGAVTIDGTTQNPGSVNPPIEVAGNGAGVGAGGLSIGTGSSTVRGLVINGFDGIGVGLSASGHILEGNFIGLNATGTASSGNGDAGVLIVSGSGHLIGGTVAAARNVISANSGIGVQVLGLGVTMNHQIRGNFIGTDATGTIGLGNQSDGIEMLSGTNSVINCTVGGTTSGARNVISANAGVGVQFITVGTSNLVQGNFIGTNSSGSNALGNGSSGVAITEANDCTVGGTVAGAGNVISGNGSNGVRINSSTASGNRVQGNRIGTRADGVTSLPNSSDGVRVINSASNNTVGGAPGEGNIIAFNLGTGVRIESGTGNAIRANSIFSNAGIGIDLGPAGVTPNDVGDGDSGANNLQNFPALTSSNGAGGGGVNVQGTLNSNPSTTFTLEFFSSSSCDPSGNGEGRVFLGSASAMTNVSGNATFNVNLVASASSGESITATATNPQGDTSEFSACVTYGAADLGIAKAASSGTITVGSNITYTITLVNNGPDSASSITVTDNLPASLTFVSCASTANGICGGSGNNRIVSFGSLGSGASATITIVGKLDCAIQNGQSIGNTASVTSPVRDPVVANNSSSVNFTASNPPRVILPTNQPFPADGGDGTVSVTAPAGCGWQAVSNDSWLGITSGASGTGNGLVGYHVAVNGTGSPRNGTLTIAGLTFTVNQSNVSCSYSILPVSESFAEVGGTGSISVTAPAGCFWKALSNNTWITIVPGTETGTGNGSVGYAVELNSTVFPRTGTVSVGGQTFTVMEAGVPCPFTLNPAGKLFGAAGKEDAFTVTTLAECEWEATKIDSWIFITSAASGTGSGKVSYGVRDNFTGSPRQGTITAGGRSFSIVQAGGNSGDCGYALNPSSAVFNAAGGNGSVQIITDAGCGWEATTVESWITVTSQIVGIGTSSVTYNVKPNVGSSGRAGVMVIGNQSFRIKQKGN